MRRTIFFTIGLVFLTLILPARADFFSANDILNACESKLALDKIRCLAYILGVQDTMASFQRQKFIAGYCPPDNMTAGQAELVAVKYFHDNPADLNTSGAANVFLALIEAFPCKKVP